MLFMIHYTATILLGAGILVAGFRLMGAGRSRSPQWKIWAAMYFAFFVGYALMEFGIFYWRSIHGVDVGGTIVYVIDGVLDPRIPLGTRFAIVAQTLGPPVWFVIFTIANERSERRRFEK